MALGDGSNYSNDNNKKFEDPTVYSPLNFKNPDADIDPSRLSFSYWKNLLKIIISPKLEQRPGDKFVQYADAKSSGAIFINPAKALMFYHDINTMLENPGTINNVSVSSGTAGLVSFCDGKEYGVLGYVLVIRKLDEEGTTQSSYIYQFNTNGYYNSIRNFDETTAKFSKHNYDRIEIDMFLQLLLNFATCQDYALAYTVVDATKYDNTRVNTKLDLLVDHFGLKSKGNSNNATPGRSYFNTNSGNGVSSDNASAAYPSSRRSSLESLAEELEG